MSDPYVNVEFDLEERAIIKRVIPHLGVTFPDAVKGGAADGESQDVASVYALHRNTGAGTYEHVTAALRAVTTLVDQLMRESSLGYWLGVAESDTGTRPEPSEEPTSTYQVLKMMADNRAWQLREAQATLAVLREAAEQVTQRPSHRKEFGA